MVDLFVHQPWQRLLIETLQRMQNMNEIYIIEITQTRGWSGQFDPPRKYIHDAYFTDLEMANRFASSAEYDSRFGAKYVVLPAILPYRE